MNSPFFRFAFLLCLSLFATAAIAQLNVVADRENAQYEAGETMTFEVSSSSPGTVSYVIQYDDKTSPLATGTVNVNFGQTASITYSHPEPGAVFCEVTKGGQTALATALFSPYEIEQEEPEPSDFESFWNNQKNLLAAVPVNPNLSLYSNSTYATTYTIELGSIDNRKVYGYISIPDGSGPFPAILELPAFGDVPNIAAPPTNMAERGGAISMSISIHNAPPNQVDPNAYQPNDVSDREEIYMRYAILAGIRSIDYLTSRNDFDGENIGVTGVSQGGALAIMLAGIDDRVNLLTYANPAWTEHGGLSYGKASGFPFYIFDSQNNNGSTSHEAATLSATRYYDVINFAKRYDGPSLGFIGYEDVISFPAGEFAAYNQLGGQKVLLHNINLGHNPTPAEYWNGRFDFFRRQFPAMLNPPFPFAAQTTGYGIDAGSNQNTAVNTPITLTGSASLNDQTNAFPGVKWEKISGPGQVDFSSSNNYATEANFSEEGTYRLRFTALDETSLSSQQSYYSLMDEVEITVGTGGNNTFLSLSCPSNISETLAPGQNGMTINWSPPIVNSNCNTSATLEQISGPANGSTLDAGSYTVSYEASNSCGDSDNCSFIVTINAAPNGNSNYCDSEATAPWQEWIRAISFSNINNNSGKEGYGDFTAQIAEVNKGQDYSLSVTAGYSWQQNASVVRTWIDYNRNNSFENDEEVLFENIPLQQGATSGLADAMISIPSSAEEGATRMRVVLQRNDSFGPCGTFQYGEVEDYTIQIAAGSGGGGGGSGGGGTGGGGGNANCESEASFPWQEWIKRVSFEDINHTSNKEGYADFTNNSTIVNSGLSYPISVTAGFSWLQQDVYLRIWIDYDQDGVFDENTEVAFSGFYDSGNFLGATEGFFVGDVDIPTTAQMGITKMRISLQREDYATPCQQYTYGEVEDYTIVVENGGGSGGGGGGPSPGNYCESEGSSPWQEYISNVQFGSIDYDSGKDKYGDFTAIQTDIEKGQTYFISLQPKFSYKHYDEYFRVWIDYNRDGDFQDSGETVLSAISPAGMNGTLPDPIIDNISIPLTAQNGATRMRVSMQRDEYANPCDDFQLGEVEDYTLVIIDETTNLQGADHFLDLSANKQQGQALLNWDANQLDRTRYFLIERSTDGVDFSVIERFDDITGVLQTFDSAPFGGRNYYRIKQIFTNGSLRNSFVRFLDFPGEYALKLFPNPVSQTLFVDMPAIRGEAASIYVVNALGQEIREYQVSEFPSGAWALPVDGMKNGFYLLKLMLADGRIVSESFLVEDGM